MKMIIRYYVDILCAVITVALSRSSWILLPRYSKLYQSLWSTYLKGQKAPKMLWPAQQLIGEKGILNGQSAIVQLPTGVGKTKSIELIIRSSFASDRATTAIIVAPLRALCNEIANDMVSAFGDEVLVNQFSDILEDDFSLDLLLSFKSKILICTPEKLSYIIHHQTDFLDEIGLYIFDEGHMFDDGSRGAIYELLISEIRDHISWKEQIILLSAVLSNAEQIFRWNDCIKMFDSSATEPCGSSILSLVQDIFVDYEAGFSGLDIAKYIIENYGKADCFDKLLSALTTALLKRYPDKTSNNIERLVGIRRIVIEAIENHLCFVFSNDENVDKQAVASEICKKTLAYFMANDKEKALLEELFNIITAKVNTLDYARVKKYAKTMIGIDLSLQIEKWITENRFTQQNYSNEQILDMLMSFFLETHTLKKGAEFFADICKMWLDGCPFIEMSEGTSLPIAAIEDICSKSVSYELSFFVGNIIDVIEISDEDIVNPLPSLLLLQRKIKYGVKTETAVSVCEKIFNDRFLANLLAEEIDHDAITANKIVGVVKSHKDDILEILSAYPTYFSERIKWVCKD